MATEEIQYDVVKKDDNIEIRDYKPVVMAEVTVEGTRREAPNKAFRILFDYISGNNVAAQEIPMTAPVSQEAASQKIPMTTPVTQEQAGDNQSWNIAFYMPSDMTMETAPKPKDDRVTMKEVRYGKMIAIRFSGLGSDENIEKFDQILKEYLKENNIKVKEEGRLVAFYNSPFVPWFLRRNEILYPIDTMAIKPNR